MVLDRAPLFSADCKPPCKVAEIIFQRKVVYVDGVFDLLHKGHLELLSRARTFGDFLLVGVHSDEAVKSYKRIPVMRQLYRYELVAALKGVDAVISGSPLFLERQYLKDWNIGAVVHGDDNLYTEMYRTAIELGIMHYVPYTRGVSTSELIAEVCRRHAYGLETEASSRSQH